MLVLQPPKKSSFVAVLEGLAVNIKKAIAGSFFQFYIQSGRLLKIYSASKLIVGLFFSFRNRKLSLKVLPFKALRIIAAVVLEV